MSTISTIYWIIFSTILLLSSFQVLKYNPDYASYEYIFINTKPSEPLFYLLNATFLKLGFSFAFFHFILSALGAFAFIKFVFKRSSNLYIIIFSCLSLYLYHLGAHWRTGLALCFICFLTVNAFSKNKILFFSGSLLHLSTVSCGIFLLIPRNIFFLILIIIVSNIFFIQILSQVEFVFDYLGRMKFFNRVVGVSEDIDSYLHRSINSFENLRIYYVILMMYLIYGDWKNQKSLSIAMVMASCTAYLCFLSNAYLAQKSFLLLKPLHLLAVDEIQSKRKKHFGYILVLSGLFIDMFERLIVY